MGVGEEQSSDCAKATDTVVADATIEARVANFMVFS
jgi:hypothetical protein